MSIMPIGSEGIRSSPEGRPQIVRLGPEKIRQVDFYKGPQEGAFVFDKFLIVVKGMSNHFHGLISRYDPSTGWQDYFGRSFEHGGGLVFEGSKDEWAHAALSGYPSERKDLAEKFVLSAEKHGIYVPESIIMPVVR